jgi:hypothetical protein
LSRARPKASTPGSAAPSSAAPPRKVSARTEELNAGVRDVFAHWRQVMGIDTPLDHESKRRIRARLVEGFTVTDLKLAIEGCRASPWHMGENPERKLSNDITIICRDGGQVRKFKAVAASAPKAPKPKAAGEEPVAFFRSPEFIETERRIREEFDAAERARTGRPNGN